MLNEKRFLYIYDEYLSSGLNIRDFCSNQQMNESKFYYWQNKLKWQLPPKRGFVPVVFGNGYSSGQSQVTDSIPDRNPSIPSPPEADKTISCEIKYPNGICVKQEGLSVTGVLEPLLTIMRG